MEIIHGIGIQTTPHLLYEALTTEKGVAAWWTKAKMSPTVGGSNEFAFSRGLTITFQCETLEEDRRVEWSAESVPPDWKGTRVVFEIASEGDGTVWLTFRHVGFRAANRMFEQTSYAWANYVRSLKLLLETGAGEPFGSAASKAAGTSPRAQ
jgi:uncharacterized protein YndB with AHSA1/START domain